MDESLVVLLYKMINGNSMILEENSCSSPSPPWCDINSYHDDISGNHDAISVNHDAISVNHDDISSNIDDMSSNSAYYWFIKSIIWSILLQLLWLSETNNLSESSGEVAPIIKKYNLSVLLAR